MPTYDYICQCCDKETELFHKISDDSVKICPSCQQPALKRKFSGGASVLIQGSGYYSTDHDPKRQNVSNMPTQCCPCGKNKGSCSE
jgi:putative FmdB family regulatory protein